MCMCAQHRHTQTHSDAGYMRTFTCGKCVGKCHADSKHMQIVHAVYDCESSDPAMHILALERVNHTHVVRPRIMYGGAIREWHRAKALLKTAHAHLPSKTYAIREIVWLFFLLFSLSLFLYVCDIIDFILNPLASLAVPFRFRFINHHHL